MHLFLLICEILGATIIVVAGAFYEAKAIDRWARKDVAEEIKLYKELIKKYEDGTVSPIETRLSREYYKTALRTANVSFVASLLFSTIGFAFILSSIYGFSTGGYNNISKMIAGIVTNSVSAMFFVQSNRAQQRMSDFFDKLRSDRKGIDAATLLKTIGDENLRDKVKSQVILSYCGVSETENKN
ncbi:hypothetical protein KSAC_09210 [Komagataeibacter saccharivorans]|uniref:TRADD-N-associated membrane domain-containing protein n=1 Tax=Komagataeibacter saccharivorans TaxID=265959 RepID=UPI001053AF0E|nr:hypothetical protein [Komagataeibacter saccharivorans]QBL93162.1 hypothetical protein KSAC_09210 [Komagataeibacter saccharivorans]